MDIAKLAFIHASGEILTTLLPDDYTAWDTKKYHKFLETESCDKYSSYPASLIDSEIQEIADSLVDFTLTYKTQLKRLL